MKKPLLILGLAALCLNGNAQAKLNSKDVFREITKDKKFEISKYRQYITNALTLPKDGKTYFSFDFDRDKKMDLMATVNHSTDKYASGVGLDINGDGKYEIIYSDENSDGYFEIAKFPDNKK
jgi:hypothetical protein